MAESRTRRPASQHYDVENELTSWNGATLAYDLNGNMASDGTNTYTWDARNQLASISGVVTASFSYDPFGRRLGKTIGAATTNFLYDGLNPVQELSGTTVNANLLTGGVDEYFTRTDVLGTSNFLSDALGSTLALADTTGTVRTSYTYQPFGGTTTQGSANGNSYQFTGRENDGDGLYFYRARYYSPMFGRFISEDPAGYYAGDNFYAYVLDSPTYWIDATGLDVTVALYPGSTPAGHIGIGVNSNETQGFYPPGAIEPDAQEGPPTGCVIIPTSPQQDQDIQKYIDRRKQHPGPWIFPGRDCSNLVHDALRAGGINVPDSTWPRHLWNDILRLPHTSCYRVTPVF